MRREVETGCRDKGGWNEAGAFQGSGEVSLVLVRQCWGSNRSAFHFLTNPGVIYTRKQNCSLHWRCGLSGSVRFERCVFGVQAPAPGSGSPSVLQTVGIQAGALVRTPDYKPSPRPTEWELAMRAGTLCFHKPSRAVRGSWSLRASARGGG